MRVFLDTNVIAGAVATRGLCADVLREVFAHHDLIVSEDLFGEVRKVLGGKLGVPAETVSEIVTLLRESGSVSMPSRTIDLAISGPAERALISAAFEGKAELFVTGDRELLGFTSFGKKMDIVSPRMFWERISGRSTE
jgi:putative PIN family toxin of toxin-antitoxin system